MLANIINAVDIHIMESDNPTLDRGDFMRMVCNKMNTKIEQTWRVRFHEDGTVAVYSFAMPPQKNLHNEPRLNKENIPVWINERIAVLQICQQGDIVDGVGQKVSDKVFYVIE